MRKIIPLIVLLFLSALFTKAQNVSQAEQNAALQLVDANKAAIGITNDVMLSNAKIAYTYEDRATGIRYVSLQQTYKDIPVYNQYLIISFRNGKLASNFGFLDPGISNLVNVPSGSPAVSAESAVQSALSDRGFRASQMAVAINRKDNGRSVEFGNMGISRENITADLMWVQDEVTKIYNLAWQVYIIPKTTSDYWMVYVNAVNNGILTLDNYTDYDNWGDPSESANVRYPDFIWGKNHSDATPNNLFDFKKAEDPSVVNTASYRVIPFPAESPIHPGGAHALRTDPWLAAVANAQTLKWNTGAAATDYDYTRGNNVWAYEDRTAPQNTGTVAKSASSTTALPNLTFNFTPNYTVDPTQRTPVPNQQFNTTNLFYWNNLVHDVLYAYGFTEASRNFQDDNLGRGGAGNDHVNAEAQDPSGTNNANFSTPADGTSGRMQMYLWTTATPNLDGDVDNGIILHEFGHGVSNRSHMGGIGCLNNAEQAGEGWSDYIALMLTQDWATATVTTGFNSPRGIGCYALNQPITGPGIRPQRYCTNFGVNNATYATLPGQAIPHGVGWVFCSALWELTWELINSIGTISPSIYNQTSTAGNVVALNLVMEGLRTQPCQPGFVTARDAILRADTTLYAASHACAIWRAFARRGIGFGASQGASTSINDQTPSFALPPACGVITGPTVTINQAAAQPDPTSVSPINFTVVFSEPVIGFATGDVTLSGTAGATLGTVTGGPTTFNVAVTGMIATGTVITNIGAGVCTNAALEPNNPSTSTDNTVTFTITAGVCTTFVGSVGPANTPVGLRAFRDGVLSTCAAPGACTASTLTGAYHYRQHTWTNPVNAVQCVTVAYTNPTTNFSFVTAHNGSVVLTNFCTNWLGDPGSSALAGATITWSFNAPPLATIVFHIGNVTAGQTADYIITVSAPICAAANNPTVTINQAAAQPDPTSVSPINFTAVFNQPVIGFATGDVVLSGTAGATAAVVTGGPTTYNVAVSGMTSSGTVIATIPAGVCTNAALDPNIASTSTDNTVTYNVVTPPGCLTTVSYTGPAVAIPDNTPAGVDIPITVAGVGNISDINFRFDADPAAACDATPGNVNAAMDHTFIGDLIFRLTSPAATTVTIVNRRGGTRENICNTLLDDDGGFPSLSTVSSTSGQFLSGNFAPDNPLSAFDGQNANGVWTLNVSDNAGIDIGSMRRFSLIFTNVIPTMPQRANDTVCAGSSAGPYNFTSVPPGATFNWTNSNPAIGLGASGTGNIPAFTATNATTAPINATIIVTPTIGTCPGTPMSFIIRVLPTGTVNPVPNQVVCRGQATAPVTFSGTTANTVYNWTNNNTSIGLAASGNGNIASFIAQNPTSVAQVATITVTPVYSPGGPGTPVLTTFNFTGAVQTWVVPPGVTSVSVKTWGAQGNTSALGVAGGLGGYSEGNLAVTPGQTLFVNVGGGGTATVNGGFNGGGAAGANAGCATAQGGGGGGASDVRVAANTLAARAIVGAGGGGAGGNRVTGCGRGAGGGGGAGYYGGGGGAGWPGVPGGQGPVPTGGTQAAGGAGGVTTFTPGPTNGFPGALGVGGAGGTEIGSAQGGAATAEPGGVGGGLIGAPGNYNQVNNWCGQSGAGGSSYIGGVTAGITTPGLRTGNGQVQISYAPATGLTCAGTPRTFTITVNPNEDLIIVADPGTTLCEGDPTRLTVHNVGSSTPPGNLYVQTGAQVNGSPSQVFEPANAAFTSQGADDFTVPAGATWTVTGITTNGINSAGGVPTSVNVFFYANSANLPGAAIASYTNLLTFVRTGANYNVTIPATTLNAGTYWMSFQVNMSFATSGQWFWGNFGTTNIGNEYAWQNPGGGFATPCTSWGYGGTGCNVGGGAANRNNIFSIIGSSVTPGTVATGTFLWSPAAGLSSTTSNPVAASPMNTTTYTVTRTTVPGGCVASAQITITVNKRPTVTTHPVSVTNCGGTTATFTVTGTGTGLTYQWQVSPTGCAGPWTNLTNTAPYSGVNTATLTINPVSTAMTGYAYRAVLSGVCPAIGTNNISNCATLTVNPLPNISITPPVSCGGVAGMSGTLLTVTASAPPIPGSVTVNSGAINVPIPDGTNVAAISTLNVAGIPANATIGQVRINMNINHTWVGDVNVNVRAPNNAILNMVGRLDGGTGGNQTDNFTNTTFSSLGGTAISGAPAPRTGIFAAEARPGGPIGYTQTVTTWGGLTPTATSANGAWVLAMGDAVATDLGTLTNWSITIDYTTPGTGGGGTFTYVWSPLAGLYTNSIATIPYTGGNTTTVYAAPTVQTVYTVTATNPATGCTSTATALVNYTPPPPTVTPNPVAMCLGDPAVRLISSSSTLTTVSFCTGTISVPIPEGTFPTGPYNPGVSTIAVSGIPAASNITRVKVRLNITHAFVGDVVAVLRAPNGQILNLDAALSATNNAGVNFVNTDIGSNGVTALSAGTAPWTGLFRADAVGATFTIFGFTLPGGPVGYIPTTQTWGPLAPTGGSANGNWTLALYDAGAPDVGTLTSWCIELDHVVGVPATRATWSPIGGLFNDANATQPYTGDARDTVWARPTPAGVYNYDVTVQGLSGTSATIPLPPHVSIFTGNVRGYWFTAPSSFTMTSVEVPTNASTGTQNIAVLRFTGAVPPPAFPGTTNAFTTLFLTQNNPAAGAIPVNIQINAGDVIGMLGVRSNINSYSGNPPNTTVINGTTVNLTRMGMQFPLATTPPQQIWQEAAFQISRVFFSYSTLVAGCTSPPRRVVVTVNQPTTLNTQLPVDQTICTDKVATFTVVVATGTGPHTYQWQVSIDNGNNWTNINNGGVYSGATTATLTITAPPVSMNGYLYRAVVNGAAPCAAAISRIARLTVNPLPTVVISANPYTSLFPGLTTTITSTSAPAAVTYTWLRNGVIVGGNTPTHVVNVDGLGNYQLRVTDVNGCTNISNTITIRDSVSAKCFIYPNPTSGQFEVRYHSVASNVLPRSLTVYDAKGDRVFTQMYTIGRPYDRMQVDMRAYGKGLYWVEIGDRNGNRLTMCRVVIQ